MKNATTTLIINNNFDEKTAWRPRCVAPHSADADKWSFGRRRRTMDRNVFRSALGREKSVPEMTSFRPSGTQYLDSCRSGGVNWLSINQSIEAIDRNVLYATGARTSSNGCPRRPATGEAI